MQRDYEEELRALGLALDDDQLHDVLLLEREEGFLVTALRQNDTLGSAETGDRYRYAEALITDGEIQAASKQGAARRGSRHRADRNEAALRLVGRYVATESGSRILVLDRGDSFLLRMLVDPDSDMPHRFVTISSSDLEQMRAEAVKARGWRSRMR